MSCGKADDLALQLQPERRCAWGRRRCALDLQRTVEETAERVQRAAVEDRRALDRIADAQIAGQATEVAATATRNGDMDSP